METNNPPLSACCNAPIGQVRDPSGITFCTKCNATQDVPASSPAPMDKVKEELKDAAKEVSLEHQALVGSASKQETVNDVYKGEGDGRSFNFTSHHPFSLISLQGFIEQYYQP